MSGEQKDGRQARLLTTKDLAEYLNVCEHTVYRWCKAGKIPHFNLNSNFRFDPSEITRWMAARHHDKASGQPDKAPGRPDKASGRPDEAPGVDDQVA